MSSAALSEESFSCAGGFGLRTSVNRNDRDTAEYSMIMSMTPFSNALASAAAVSLLSLVGIASLPFSDESLKRITFILVSLATGALFGDAILHILPEVFKGGDHRLISSLWVLAGFCSPLYLRNFCAGKITMKLSMSTRLKPVGRIILLSDGLHNLGGWDPHRRQFPGQSGCRDRHDARRGAS